MAEFRFFRFLVIWLKNRSESRKPKAESRKVKAESQEPRAESQFNLRFVKFSLRCGNPSYTLPEYSSPPGSQARARLYWRMGWMDGWDGWMDGLVSTCFCSAYFSKTTKYMTLIVFGPQRRRFKTSFVKKSKFLKKLFFVKKFRTKRVFFEIFFSKVSILKRIPIFLD